MPRLATHAHRYLKSGRSLLGAAFTVGVFTLTAAPAGAAPTWLSPVTASIPTTCSSQGQAKPVMAPDGTTIAAWQRRDDGCAGVTRVEVAIRPPGGSFGTPITLSNPALESTTPRIAVDAAGNVIVIWIENGFISYSQRPAGGSFAAAQTIAGSSPAGSPAVAIGGGTAVATWIQAGTTKVVLKTAGSGTFAAPT